MLDWRKCEGALVVRHTNFLGFVNSIFTKLFVQIAKVFV